VAPRVYHPDGESNDDGDDRDRNKAKNEEGWHTVLSRSGRRNLFHGTVQNNVQLGYLVFLRVLEVCRKSNSVCNPV